jgi:hypothetical protein
MTTKTMLPSDCLPIIPEAEFSKVSVDGLNEKVSHKYGNDDTSEANAYKKLAKMFASSQNGGIGAPKNVTYWAWRTLTDEDEAELFKDEARFVISMVEMSAPIYGGDVDALDDAIQRIDEGGQPTEMDLELLDECKKLSFKWIDVAVRTKSNRNGLKQIQTTAA